MDEDPYTAFFCALRQAAADRAIPSPDPGRRLSEFGCEKVLRIKKAAGKENLFLPRRRRFACFQELRLRPARERV